MFELLIFILAKVRVASGANEPICVRWNSTRQLHNANNVSNVNVNFTGHSIIVFSFSLLVS